MGNGKSIGAPFSSQISSSSELFDNDLEGSEETEKMSSLDHIVDKSLAYHVDGEESGCSIGE